MHERIYCPPRRGDLGLVESKYPSARRPRGERTARIWQWNLTALLLGCALFIGACASDSSDDHPQHRHHRHGNGHGRDQTEASDRSDNPSPTPALGW